MYFSGIRRSDPNGVPKRDPGSLEPYKSIQKYFLAGLKAYRRRHEHPKASKYSIRI